LETATELRHERSFLSVLRTRRFRISVLLTRHILHPTLHSHSRTRLLHSVLRSRGFVFKFRSAALHRQQRLIQDGAWHCRGASHQQIAARTPYGSLALNILHCTDSSGTAERICSHQHWHCVRGHRRGVSIAARLPRQNISIGGSAPFSGGSCGDNQLICAVWFCSNYSFEYTAFVSGFILCCGCRRLFLTLEEASDCFLVPDPGA